MTKQYVKNVGIEGVNPPEEVCDDKNCPWHGEIRVRGFILKGKIIKAKAPKTAVVEIERYFYLKKYERYEKRRTRLLVHVPPCIKVKKDDVVIIGETRPISKEKHFVVLDIVK